MTTQHEGWHPYPACKANLSKYWPASGQLANDSATALGFWQPGTNHKSLTGNTMGSQNIMRIFGYVGNRR